MFNKADVFVFIALVLAFALAVWLWFSGNREQGLFAATWVPAILCFGIYFKLLRQRR